MSGNIADLDVIRRALAEQPEALAEFEKHIGNDRDALGFAFAANIGPIRVHAIEAEAAEHAAAPGLREACWCGAERDSLLHSTAWIRTKVGTAHPFAAPARDAGGADWWGIDHRCAGVERVYPTLHWAEEPEVGAGPRRAFQCDACGKRYAFHEARDAGGISVERLARALQQHQDHSGRLPAHARYHCGGTCAAAILAALEGEG